MAENYDLLKQLINGQISRDQYEKKVYDRRIAALRATVPQEITAENEEDLLNARSTFITDRFGTPPQDITAENEEEVLTARSQGIADRFGTPPQDEPEPTPVLTDEQAKRLFESQVPEEAGSFEAAQIKTDIVREGGGPALESQDNEIVVDDSVEEPTSDNGTEEPTGDEDTVTTTTVVTEPPPVEMIGRLNSQIWQDTTGQKYLTFGIPGTNMFIRYKASDDDLSSFFTTGMPGIRSISEDEEDWNNSLWLGGYNEIDGDIKLGLSNPFDAMVDNFAKVKKVQPWMETDELYSLWLEGIVEDRPIADYEWQGTEWWQTHTQEQRDWLLTSQGQGVDNLPADAKAFLDNNRIRAAEILRQNGVSNADEVVNADGDSLVEFFATQLTTGNWTELTWARQAQGLGDPLAGIDRDNQLITWLEGTQELPVETTQAGYAQVKSLAQKWLGPNFAEFENANLDEYAGILRNAESEAVGIAMIEDKLKNIRKALFTTDLYEENLTYEDIASPWRNYSYQYLGERMDETSAEWLNILKANDQEKINTILTEYGLNNDNQTMFDKVTDGIVEGIAAPVVRGIAT